MAGRCGRRPRVCGSRTSQRRSRRVRHHVAAVDQVPTPRAIVEWLWAGTYKDEPFSMNPSTTFETDNGLIARSTDSYTRLDAPGRRTTARTYTHLGARFVHYPDRWARTRAMPEVRSLVAAWLGCCRPPHDSSTATRFQPNTVVQDGTGWDESLSVTPKTVLFVDSLVQDGTRWDSVSHLVDLALLN